MIRRAAVAGRWYSDDPSQLTSDVEQYLRRVPRAERTSGFPRAVIVPHAGLMYSGPVAAFAYDLVSAAPYAAIVLIGPSHFVPFRGVSMWARGAWQTPLGAVQVDEDLAAAIRFASDEIVDLPAAHGREHSLEMQLPFVAHLLRGVPIVPLVMGEQTRETAFSLGTALARVLRDADERLDANAGNVLLVASSDLSHYHDARVAARMDAVVIRHIEALDPDGLMEALEREPGHACGGGPIVAVLHAAQQLGASAAQVVCYADSGDVSGDKSAVVGYLAAAVF